MAKEPAQKLVSTTVPLLEAGEEFGPEILLATRQGNKIRNLQRYEASPVQLRAWTKLIKDQCCRAQLRSSVSIYNCVGMVFASRRTWIDIDLIKWILIEDGYHPFSELGNSKSGDLVLYRDTLTKEYVHVGMIIGEKLLLEGSSQSEIWVISQFGKHGEWIHPLEHVLPNYKGGLELWTDRR